MKPLTKPPTSYGQPSETVTAGTSWWLGLSREELTREAARRAALMGSTQIGKTVQSRVNEL